MAKDQQEIQITGEPTLDPSVCKFIVSRPVLAEGSVICRDKEAAKGSPLLEKLFAIDGITQVMVAGSVVTIGKQSPDPWPALGKRIGGAIRDSLSGDQPAIDPEMQKKAPSDEKIAREIEDLFEKEINPAIASHGGFVELADVEGTTVYLRLGGGCQGCASANVTLRQGIEEAIRARIPEVGEIVDVTDHASGANPYYR